MAIMHESKDVNGNLCWIMEEPDRPGLYAIGGSAADVQKKFAKALKVWNRVRGNSGLPERTETFGVGVVLLYTEACTFDVKRVLPQNESEIQMLETPS